MEHQPQSLLIASGRYSLSLIKESSFVKAYIQFWQTWSNYEIASFLYQNPLIPADLQTQAYNRMIQWSQYNENDFSGSPAYVKNANFFENRNFWDPENKNIIWDDRIWLGNAYVTLYQSTKIQKFLKTAIQLFEFIVKYNWEPNNYQKIEWKPKSNYFNTITNSLFFVMCGRLYQATGDKKYLDSALKLYKFLFCQQGKFANGVNDGVFPDHHNPHDGGFYTYNQGVPLQGLVYLIAYCADNNEMIEKAIKLINSTVHYFKIKVNRKYISAEFSQGDHASLRTSSIFRSFVFRAYVYMKRVLPPTALQKILSKTPLFRLYIIENAQAMCKFQNLKPGIKWEVYNDGMIHEYNSFNQFYVLLAAHQLFKIQQITVDGVGMKGNGLLTVDIGSTVKACYLSHILSDAHKGVYFKDKPICLRQGHDRMEDFIQENLNHAQNCTTFMELQILYEDGKHSKFVLVHLEGQTSKFGLIPDQSAEHIANTYIARIKIVHMQGVTYDTSTGKKVSLCNSSGNLKTPAHLRLIIH